MVTFFDETYARSIGLRTRHVEDRLLHTAERLHRGGAADRRVRASS